MMTDEFTLANLRISVVTISYNSREFLEDTIKSVQGQTYRNVEYIVIDGGSTDGTVDIIKTYESGITKWLSEPDKGIADAFNKGLIYTTGDYVLFLNSDDALVDQNVLEKIAREIAGNDYPAMLYGDYNVIERNSGEFLYRGRVKYSPDKLKYGQVLPHPCLFTHRSYFERYGNFDTQFEIAMDYEWLLRGGLKERVVHVPVLTTSVRSGGISTHNQKRVVTEIIEALKKNKYICSSLGEYELKAYFVIRTFARNILDVIGLYKLFARLRNRIKNG